MVGSCDAGLARPGAEEGRGGGGGGGGLVTGSGCTLAKRLSFGGAPTSRRHMHAKLHSKDRKNYTIGKHISRAAETCQNSSFIAPSSKE